jgi:hypothetical protein
MNLQVRAYIDPPQSDGGSPITGYQARAPFATSNWSNITRAADGLVTINLTANDGDALDVAVRAVNATGAGQAGNLVSGRLTNTGTTNNPVWQIIGGVSDGTLVIDINTGIDVPVSGGEGNGDPHWRIYLGQSCYHEVFAAAAVGRCADQSADAEAYQLANGTAISIAQSSVANISLPLARSRYRVHELYHDPYVTGEGGVLHSGTSAIVSAVALSPSIAPTDPSEYTTAIYYTVDGTNPQGGGANAANGQAQTMIYVGSSAMGDEWQATIPATAKYKIGVHRSVADAAAPRQYFATFDDNAGTDEILYFYGEEDGEWMAVYYTCVGDFPLTGGIAYVISSVRVETHAGPQTLPFTWNGITARGGYGFCAVDVGTSLNLDVIGGGYAIILKLATSGVSLPWYGGWGGSIDGFGNAAAAIGLDITRADLEAAAVDGRGSAAFDKVCFNRGQWALNPASVPCMVGRPHRFDDVERAFWPVPPGGWGGWKPEDWQLDPNDPWQPDPRDNPVSGMPVGRP